MEIIILYTKRGKTDILCVKFSASSSFFCSRRARGTNDGRGKKKRARIRKYVANTRVVYVSPGLIRNNTDGTAAIIIIARSVRRRRVRFIFNRSGGHGGAGHLSARAKRTEKKIIKRYEKST